MRHSRCEARLYHMSCIRFLTYFSTSLKNTKNRRAAVCSIVTAYPCWVGPCLVGLIRRAGNVSVIAAACCARHRITHHLHELHTQQRTARLALDTSRDLPTHVKTLPFAASLYRAANARLSSSYLQLTELPPSDERIRARSDCTPLERVKHALRTHSLLRPSPLQLSHMEPFSIKR